MANHVLSVGGSVLIKDGKLDVAFLKDFANIIRKNYKKGENFAIFVGGGKTARDYIEAGKEFGIRKTEVLDEIGIKATLLNAELVRSVLGDDIVMPDVFRNTMIAASEFRDKIVVCGGWRPGSSTDYVAVLFANQKKINTVINLTNIDYVYEKNPKEYKDARKIKEITWEKYNGLVSAKWKPGMHTPFDPRASKFAMENKIKVIVANGDNLRNLENVIAGKPFIGTTIL